MVRQASLLEMKCTAAPFLGSDIGDGFGEVPAVAIKVLNVVLAFAIGLVLRFRQDNGAVLPGALAMAPGIFNANLNDMGVVGHDIAFSDGDAAIAGFHLDAVIGDAQTDGKPKSLREPIGGRGWIRIKQNWNYDAGRHRSVESHPATLSLRLTRSQKL